MDYKDYICKDQDGNLLISVDDMNEDILSSDSLFTHCLVVVKVGDEYLLGRNKWRNRFEIFGGCATAAYSDVPNDFEEDLRVIKGKMREDKYNQFIELAE